MLADLFLETYNDRDSITIADDQSLIFHAATEVHYFLLNEKNIPFHFTTAYMKSYFAPILLATIIFALD